MVGLIIRRAEEKREGLRTWRAYKLVIPKHAVLHQEITNFDLCRTSTQTENYFKICLGI
jgi:hypothetical protein